MFYVSNIFYFPAHIPSAWWEHGISAKASKKKHKLQCLHYAVCVCVCVCICVCVWENGGSSDSAHLSDGASKLIVITVCKPSISLFQIKQFICHSETDVERTGFLFIKPTEHFSNGTDHRLPGKKALSEFIRYINSVFCLYCKQYKFHGGDGAWVGSRRWDKVTFLTYLSLTLKIFY